MVNTGNSSTTDQESSGTSSQVDAHLLKGYGVSHTGHLIFNSDKADFRLWEMRFLGYLRSLKLQSIFEDESSTSGFVGKNSRVYDILISLLDDFSLRLIQSINTGDGRGAFNALKAHFVGGGKSRMYTLVSQLCFNEKHKEEDITKFLLRTEEIYIAMRSFDTTLPEFLEDLIVGSILNALSCDSD